MGSVCPAVGGVNLFCDQCEGVVMPWCVLYASGRCACPTLDTQLRVGVMYRTAHTMLRVGPKIIQRSKRPGCMFNSFIRTALPSATAARRESTLPFYFVCLFVCLFPPRQCISARSPASTCRVQWCTVPHVQRGVMADGGFGSGDGEATPQRCSFTLTTCMPIGRGAAPPMTRLTPS